MIHIIANPAAQSGAGRKITRQLLRECKRKRIPTCLHLTTHPGHAGEMAAALHLTPKDLLMIIGGDGSINEVINGFHFSPVCPLLLLPAGSGNDFARGIGMSKKPEDVLNILQNHRLQIVPELLDIGEVSVHLPEHSDDDEPLTKKFAVSCGLGMDAAVCVRMGKGKLKQICNRLHIGKLSYLILGVQELLSTSKKKRATIQLTVDYNDTELFDDVAFISIHNLTYEGGGFPFAPTADPQDGLLTVCVVHVKHRILLVPILLASLMKGSHVKFMDNVHTYHCKRVEIRADRPMAFHSDGEPIEDIEHIEVESVPDFLPLLYKKKSW